VLQAMNPGAIHWMSDHPSTRNFRSCVPDGILVTSEDASEIYELFVEHQQLHGFGIVHPDVLEDYLHMTVI